ncbi:MAG: hypothetical protein V2B18_25450 [Pseudomonadota bacterium]
MSEPVQIVIGLFFLAGIFVMTRYVAAMQMKRATGRIIRDLQDREAIDPITAVELPYVEPNPLRIGMRNYHSKAVEYMTGEGVVGKTVGGKYYLRVESSRIQAPGSDGQERKSPT